MDISCLYIFEENLLIHTFVLLAFYLFNSVSNDELQQKLLDKYYIEVLELEPKIAPLDLTTALFCLTKACATYDCLNDLVIGTMIVHCVIGTSINRPRHS